MNLWDAVKEIPIIEVAKALDIKIVADKGPYTIALCPFHGDHLGEGGKANLSLLKAKNSFKCFVCAAAGTVVDLWAKLTSVEPQAAVHAMAEKFGVQDPGWKAQAKEKKKGKTIKEVWDADRIGKANEFLFDTKNTAALEHLCKLRHLSPEYVKAKRIGLDIVYGKLFYIIPAFAVDGSVLSIRIHNRIDRKDKRMVAGYTTKILYDLAAYKPDDPELWICEGEGDLWTLQHTLGRNALTSFAGAASIPAVFKDNLALLGDLTKKTRIMLCPDNDHAGEGWAAQLRYLFPKEAPVFKIYWPKDYLKKEDVSYFIHT
jgi:DNA primase